MAAATLTFPSQTLLKNVVDPVDGTDAATKTYVDSKTGAGSVAAAGSNTQIQFNSAGSIGASANLTFDYSGKILTIAGNIVSANANLGNLVTANFYTGDGGLLSNIQSAGGTASTVSASAQPNITSVGNLINLTIGSGTPNVYIDGTGDANFGGNIVVEGLANFTTLLVGTTSSNVYVNNAGDITAGGNVTVNGDLTVLGTVTITNSEIINQDELVTGNITAGNASLGNLATANYFSGDGSLLTNINGGIVSSVANANYANYAGNVVDSVQTNITTLGTLTGLTVSGDANVQGNLTVGGTLTYIDSTKVSIVDPILELGGGPDGETLTSIATQDRGILLHNYNTDAVDAYMGWQISSNNFIFGSNVVDTAGVITVNQFANVKALTFLGNVLSNVANISNLNAGNANFSQPVKVTSPADSTDSETGALILTLGGLGVAGNINSGQDISGVTLTGPLTTAVQPNITTIGTLGNLAVTNNITSSNINVSKLFVTSISTLGNVGNVKITGGTSGQYLQTDGTGNLVWQDAASTNAILNGTSNIIVNNDGKVTISSIENSNVIVVDGNAVSVNGTLSISDLTTANALIVASTIDSTSYATGALTIAGGLGIAGNTYTNENLIVNGDTFTNDTTIQGNSVVQGFADFENLVTLTAVTDSTTPSTGALILTTGGLGVAGNINSGQDISGATLTGPLTTPGQPNITSVGTLTGLVVSGDITGSGASPAPSLSGFDSVSAVNLTGSLTTSSQTNITSVGSLLDLSVIGNITTSNLTVSGNTNLGSTSNITITGGTSGQYLQTDGQGNVSWKSVSTSALVNGSSNIVINPSGNVNISADSSANVLQVASSQVVIGPTTDSTSYTTGAFLVNGGVGIAGNLFINGLLNVSGDFQVGNLNTSGPVAHTGEVSFTQLTYFTNATASTNTTSGAVQITGGLGVQGNIFGGNIVSAANTVLRNGKNVPTFVSSTTMPSNPLLGDEWYDQSNDRIYQYIYDGTNYNWIDVSGGYISANVDAQPGTLVVRDSNGNVYANTVVANSLSVTNLAITGTTSISSMVSAGSGLPVSNSIDTVIDSFPKSLYRSAKYIISARNDDGFEVMEALVIHDDDISFIQTYGDVSTGSVADIVTLSSDIVAGNVRLYAIGSNSNTYVNLVSTYVTD